jgi:hypothetical protein
LLRTYLLLTSPILIGSGKQAPNRAFEDFPSPILRSKFRSHICRDEVSCVLHDFLIRAERLLSADCIDSLRRDPQDLDASVEKRKPHHPDLPLNTAKPRHAIADGIKRLLSKKLMI